MDFGKKVGRPWYTKRAPFSYWAIGSFLDHDRPYIPAKNPIAADSALAAFVRSQLADFVHLDKETMAEGLGVWPRTSPSVRLWMHPDWGTRVNLKHQTGWISKTMIPGPVVPKPLVILARSGEPYPTSFHLPSMASKGGEFGTPRSNVIQVISNLFFVTSRLKRRESTQQRKQEDVLGDQLMNNSRTWFDFTPSPKAWVVNSYSFSCFPRFFTQFSNFPGFFGVRRVWLLNL